MKLGSSVAAIPSEFADTLTGRAQWDTGIAVKSRVDSRSNRCVTTPPGGLHSTGFDTITHDVRPDFSRCFYGFGQAAAENGDSRILAGIHFRSSVLEGMTPRPEMA